MKFNRIRIIAGCVLLGGFVATAAAPSLPAQVDLRTRFTELGLPARAQGKRGTCSVFALTGAIEYALARQTGTGTPMSVEYLNWAANQTRTRVRDGGFFSELWSGYESKGICAESALPYQTAYDAGLTPSAELLRSAQAATNTPLRLTWIKPWDVRTGLSDAQFAEIRRVLASGWPVAAGLRWPKRERWMNGVLQPARPEEVFDGHSVLVCGYRDETAQPGGGVFLIRNSGGPAREGSLAFGYARDYVNDAV